MITVEEIREYISALQALNLNDKRTLEEMATKIDTRNGVISNLLDMISKAQSRTHSNDNRK